MPNKPDLFSKEWEVFMEDTFGSDLFLEVQRCGDALDYYYDGNMSRMARELNLSQSTLYRTFRPSEHTAPSTLKKRLFKVAKSLDREGIDLDEIEEQFENFDGPAPEGREEPGWASRLAPPEDDPFAGRPFENAQEMIEEVHRLEAENQRLQAKIEALKEVIADMDNRRWRGQPPPGQSIGVRG